jgi:hypothetical protein
MTDPLAPARICTYCDRPITGIARRISPDGPALVDLGHDACYERYLDALLTAAMTGARR